MEAVHPTTTASPDVASATESLIAAAASTPSEPLLLALAHLAPSAAASVLISEADAVRAVLAPAALGRVIAAIASASAPADRTADLVRLFGGAAPADALAMLLSRAPVEDADELVAAALAAHPTSPALLRVAADRAVRAQRADAHALLTRLARADDRLTTVRHAWRSRAALPAPAGDVVRLALLSSYTVDMLVPYVDFECRALGLVPELYVAPFNSWTRDVLDESSGLRRADPEITFLAVSIDDLVPQLAGAPSRAELDALGEEALERVLAAARRFVEWSAGVLVVHSFHSAFRDPLGVLAGRESPSRGEWLASLDARLAAALRELPRAYLLDIGEVLHHRAGGAVDNPKTRHMGAMRLGEQVLGAVAREYARYIAPLKGRTRKCVVLDLDNTLWGGIVGEDGLHGIRLGDTSPGSEYRELQQYLLTLPQRGILLALNSKNNPEDALEVLRSHGSMLLREEAFSAVRINWRPKPDNMREIAAELNIGLDSLVFVDDNPKERELMRQALPEVLTVELPNDPALYRSTLEALPELQSLVITDEDRARASQYRANRQREVVRTSATSLDDYLRSLEIVVEIADATDAMIPRVHQLFQRTNQFNLTTRRYEAGELAARARSNEWRLYALRARDRFGEHGLVAAALVRATLPEWSVDSLLMSCRVIGYGVETSLIATIVAEARASGASAVTGELIPTKKNAPARDFYERHFFSREGEDESGVTRWRYDLSSSSLQPPPWVHLERRRREEA